MNFEITDEIKKDDEDIIFHGLLGCNLERIEDKNPKDLAIYLKNENGKLITGLIGNIHGNWLSVKFLWVI